MAHFYGSITTGHVSASLAMRKLLSFNSKNEFYNGSSSMTASYFALQSAY
jgi:hypothetical protein